MEIKFAQDENYRKYASTIKARGADKCFIRFAEEVGEIAKALRNGDRRNLEEELADGFAWLLTIASVNEVDLEASYLAKYGASACFRCQKNICICAEVQRMAHFTTPPDARKFEVDLPGWQRDLETTFYEVPLGHLKGCELDTTDVCTCGAQSSRKRFKNLMTVFLKEIAQRFQ